MSLSNLATSWIRANCPGSDVQADMLGRFQDAMQRGVGCTFLLGRQLVKSRKPFLVACFCGELFAFQLTPRQAAKMNVKDKMLVASIGLSPHFHAPRPEVSVRLNQVEIEGAAMLDRNAPIVGTLQYAADRPWPTPVAIQAVCEPAGRSSVVLYHHLAGLQAGVHTIRFSLSAPQNLQDRSGEPFVGVAPLFFQICLFEGPAGPSAGQGMSPLAATPPGTPGTPPQLGEPYVPPAAGATSMPMPLNPLSPHPAAGFTPQVFRAISDIRAVLVELV